MKANLTLYLTLVLIVNNFLFGQSHTDFLQRYWNYRYRLLGDRVDPFYPSWEPGMVILGQGQPGFSLPASSVEPNNNNWLSTFSQTQGGFCGNQGNYAGLPDNKPQISGVMHWEEYHYTLGRYIMVLATEYKLLKNNSQNTDNVETELYYALKAVERLDLRGEEVFGLQGQINGFIARDDVPADFALNNSNHFGGKYRWVTSDGACYYKNACIEGGCSSGIISTPEPSKDQMIALLIGLNLISEILPPISILSNSPDPSFNCVNFARNEISEIVNYMRNSHGGNDWIIAKPDGVSCGGDNNARVCRGSEAYVYSWPLFMVKRRAEGHGWLDNAWPINCWQNNADGTTCWYWVAWRGLCLWYNFIGNSNTARGDLYFTECDNSNPLFPLTSHTYVGGLGFNNVMTANVALMYGPNTGSRLSLNRNTLAYFGFDRSYLDKSMNNLDDEIWFDLLGAYLFHYSPWIAYDRYLCRLKKHAPVIKYLIQTAFRDVSLEYDCNIPAYTYDVSTPWPLGPTFGAQLDYMLTANLLQLKWPHYYYDLATGQTVTYSNLMERNVTNTFPFTAGNATYGNNPNTPIKVEAAYRMTVDAKVLSGGRVDFRAPHSESGPHLLLDYGSTVTWTPGRMSCDPNTIIPFPVAKTDEASNEDSESDYQNYTTELSHDDSVELKKIETLGLDAYLNYTYDSLASIYPEMAKEAGYVLSKEREKQEDVTANVYPNPNEGSFKIKISIPVSDEIKIDLYNLLGAKVALIVNGYYQSGNYTFNYNGQDLHKGVYVIKIAGINFSMQKQVVIQ